MSRTLLHPHTGEPLEPVGYVNGRPVWPILGASPDDDSNESGEGENEGTDEGTDDGEPGDKGTDDGKGTDQAKPADKGEDKDWQKFSRTWEQRSKTHEKNANAAAEKLAATEARLKAVLKAAGIEDEEEDPTEQVKRAAKERDDALAEARTIKAERTAEKVGRALGADPDALLDSRVVAKALEALEDPTDADAVKGVIEQALKDNPRLKAATPKRTPTADLNGGGGEGKAGPMSIEDRREARRKRRATD